MFSFWVLHICRMFLGWIHEIIMEPIETYLDKYAKKESSESQWLQMYHLTSSYCVNSLGLDDWFFQSEDIYYYPYTKDFSTFVEEETSNILRHPMKMPKYDADVKQIPEIVETLLISKNQETYTFRSFPVLKTISSKQTPYDPKQSNVEFIFVEYNHPKMYEGIQMNIPRGFYMVGNELFSPAFVLRFLELQKKYYVFDNDYEICFVDHECEKKTINCEQYIEVLADSYEIRPILVEEMDEKIHEHENEDEHVRNSDETDPDMPALISCDSYDEYDFSSTGGIHSDDSDDTESACSKHEPVKHVGWGFRFFWNMLG